MNNVVIKAAPTEKIGTEAMIIALMVGEPVSFMP